MAERLYKRGAKITAYRALAGTPGGFVASNPTYFDTLPNAIEITDLRVQFTVEKDVDKDPNTIEVIVTNAAETTRVDLQAKPLIVRIDAGYDGTMRHLFTGDLRYGYSELVDTEWLTHLRLADGDRAYRHGRVNRSYKKGTTVATALQDAAKTMGLKIDAAAMASSDLQAQFASGRVLNGPTRDELTRLLAPYGYTWSIQDGRMQVLKDNQARQDEAWLIAEETGMIGSPEYSVPDKPGKAPKLQVRTLLYPELTPGGRIDLRSRGISGIFKIERVTHSGDTAGDGDWFTEIEAKAI